MFVDPLAEQFVGWTPYHYVHQNPINLIDPTGMSAELYDDPPENGTFVNGDVHTDSDGSWTYQNGVWYDNSGQENNFLQEITIETVSSDATVNVFTETDGVGHTYIQVGNNVFSNGRYNGSDSPSMGAYGVTGDNVLIKYSGQEATDFINKRISSFPTTKQEVKNIDASKAFRHLNNRYNDGASNKFGSGVVDGRYNLFSRNCTTCTIEALNAGGGKFDALAPKALPFQINLHNSGTDPKTFFRNAQARALRGPKL